MPKLIFTPEELKGYFKENVKHHFYEDTVKHADALKVHADGTFPEALIKTRRPNEPEEVLKYRADIFVPKTKPVFGKVVSSLSKIRRSSDWSIRYGKENERFTKILDEETLESYCEKVFQFFTSFTNWVFSVLLKKYLEDPNGLVFVFPMEVNIQETEYLKPYPVIFESRDVLDFVQEDYAVVKNPLGSTYYIRGKAQKGDSFYIITTERIQRFDQVNSKGDIKLILDYEHQLGELPVFRIGAIVAKADGNNYYHESRVAAMLPELDEALREYSDLQAAKVLHIYPERWEYTQNECPTCKGTSRMTNPKWCVGCAEDIPNEIPCDNPLCHSGYIVAGPYSKTIIRPPNGALEGQTSIPTPPGGFFEKDVEIVKIQDEGVNAHLYSALAALNFQFLDQAPLNQSGVAKEVDKDELNNTVNAIAEDIVRVMDSIYRLIAFFRYRVQYSFDDIEEFMLPTISVPEKFDLLSTSHLEEELKNAKTNNLNPELLNQLEMEYASKKFNTDPAVRDKLMLILELDPMANITEDQKMTRLSNKGITLETYIISSNIHEFVQQAIDENPDFPELGLSEQKKKMREYAQSQIQAQDEAKKIVSSVTQDTGLDPVTGEPLPPTNGKMQPNEMVMDNATV